MHKEEIAIVGIGCQTPGQIHGPESFYSQLMNGVDGITDIPKDRWNHEEYYDPNPNKAGKIKTKKGGFLDRVDLFDNEFFKIFPKEAERIDPQQRLLLQTTFESIEDSGDTLSKVRGSNMAVFMSVFTNDYWDMQIEQDSKYAISPHVAMGASRTAISNRISYFYDLKGPSVSVDTACSGALVAVHLACQSIWDQSATSAMAGGVNVIINPESTMMMSKGNFLSPDGYCKSFDERANGYVRGEGVGVVYLKPLSQALKDKNKIYGLIKATACNSDGNTVEGFTVPSETSQTAMLTKAYQMAGVDVDKLQYIEAHGTGTPVGDPIETKSFSNVFGGRSADSPLMIGSVKTNIGHLEGAAGVAGLIKLALSMKNKKIPGNLHFQKVNPKIDLEGWKLKVVSENTEWPEQKDGSPRIGGVNSFGAGGTNAHLVLQEYVAKEEAPSKTPEENMYLFKTSAMSLPALKNLLLEYKQFIAEDKYSLRDICYNAGVRRSDLKHRIAIAFHDKADILDKIDAYLAGNVLSGVTVAEVDVAAKKLGFVFTGQGPQWYAMGQELIANEPLFKSTIQTIEGYFKEIAGWSLLEEMNKDEENSNINDTRIAQPAIMAIQIALVELWKKHGVTPEGVVGHSIGEVAAAYTSGALTLEQAVSVIFHRSRGQHAATGKGKMLAVGLKLAEAEKLIEKVNNVVSIGAVNGPEMCVLSGDEAPLVNISEQLTEKDIFNKFLRVTVPFHSHHMEPLKDELIDSLKSLVPSKAKIDLYSTVTGKQEDGSHLVSEYWYDNVREPVYFASALEQMVEDGYDFFIEIGPHPALSSGAEQVFEMKNSSAVIFPSIKRKENEKLRFLQTLGSLYTHGIELDWDAIYPTSNLIYDLPNYTWDLKSFWHEPAKHRARRLNKKLHPLIKEYKESGLGENDFSFEVMLDRRTDPYIDDHRVNDAIIFPGTGHLEIATSAAMIAFEQEFGFLEDINFDNALFLPEEGEPAEVKIEVFSEEGRYCILTKDTQKEDAQWIKNSNGKMNMLGDQFISKHVKLNEIKHRVNDRLPVQPMYLELKKCGLQYGPAFKLIKNLWVVGPEILAKVDLHESLEYGVEDYNLHPAVLDACLQSMFAAKMSDDDEERGIYLPTHIDRYKFHAKPKSKSVYSYIQVEEASSEFLRGDFWIMDEDGSLVAEIQGIDFKYIEGSRKQEEDVSYSGCFEFEWDEIKPSEFKPSHNTILVIREEDFVIKSLNKKLVDNNTTLIHSMITDYSDREMVRAELKKVKEMNPTLNRAIITLPLTEKQGDLKNNAVNLSWKILNIFNAIIQEELQFSIWIVNQNAENVLESDPQINLAQAPTYGLSRVMFNEYPMVTCKVADLSDIENEKETANLANIISSPSNGGTESDLAFRGKRIFSKRLQAVSKEKVQEESSLELAASGSYYQTVLREQGMIDSIAFRQTVAQPLSDSEIEIDIKAAGINRRDLWNIQGSLSEESLAGGLAGSQIGLECSGVVSRIGSKVSHVKPGDDVLAYAANSFAGKTISQSHCVVKKPNTLSHEAAATIPVAYLTAYYCMVQLGQIESGERILIHQATEDAGLAAISLAKWKKVEIYATADTDDQRKLLTEMGISYVYDSQSATFYDEVMKDSNGEGVDLVLNTLSGKAIVQSIKCLRAFGRFIELGKKDIYQDISLHLKRFGNNLSYSAVDLDRLMAQKPQKAAIMFREVMELIENKSIQPLTQQVFSINDLSEALQSLSKEESIGKTVVSMEGETVHALPLEQIQFAPDKSYIITGGASGFGIEIAKWMAEKGAKHLALVSRSGPKNDYDYSWINKMKQSGVDIMIENLDLSQIEQVKKMTQRVHEHAPIGGVIHGAAVLQDATISRMDKALFEKVFVPKAMGAWNLHQTTEDLDLDYFLCFSSVSSVVGVPGQSNYSSANNFLDKLVDYRKQKGLHAQSINLGVLGQYAGMTKDGNGAVLNVLDSQGWIPLTLKQILSKLEKLMLEGDRIRMATNVDWLRFRDFFQHLRKDGKFAHLLTDEVLKVGASKSNGEGLRETIIAAEDQAPALLIEHLKGSLARILGTTADKLNEGKSISAIGLDSLMMNQLRNWILQKLEINYPLMRLSKGPSIVEIADHLLENLKSSANESVEQVLEDESGITSEEDIEVINEWFVHKKREASETEGKIKLFMFHSMGAGASMFDHFLYNVPDGTDVYAVQMPGRENRKHEDLYTDFTLLLDDLENEILPLLDERFAFFGHSFGGMVAFELSRRLRRKYGKTPLHFFCSGTMAPQMTITWKNRDVLKQSAISSNSEQKLLGLMSYIDDVNYVKKILPILRLDMALLTSYEFQEEDRFDFPITVFSAIEDEVTLPEEMRPWEDLTNAKFKQELVHGDHWFVSRNKDFIREKISDDLRTALTIDEEVLMQK
ncbi:type I polyketide synthase [Reichenbachiella ulvae]|uniref:SDR family NAD(P)-dependent oxidoreductase n=1 Tax=Reichenbachiella ulvae TaxID=2980104 RepID=A0ABT3D0L0_9BACT|nr:type I polyketide synthase [Reichenbachiella ulvae]MCV9389356.1 SDR family NAD(P)-dependent oxidoreductase [Reichenbachiella ulvae]